MHIREVAPTELACCMRSCVRLVRLIQSWLRRKRARSQRCSFESPSVAYDSPEHCQSTKHGSTSNRTTSQKIKSSSVSYNVSAVQRTRHQRAYGGHGGRQCETWAQYEADPLSERSCVNRRSPPFLTRLPALAPCTCSSLKTITKGSLSAVGTVLPHSLPHASQHGA